MLTAVPKNWLFWDYELFDERGLAAALDLSGLPEAGTLSIRGNTYEMGREGLVSGAFFLRYQGQVLASATIPGFLLRSYEVVVSPRAYRLEAVWPIMRRFDLHAGDRIAGTVRPVRVFSSKVSIELPDDIPLETQLFIAWLVLLQWKRAFRQS